MTISSLSGANLWNPARTPTTASVSPATSDSLTASSRPVVGKLEVEFYYAPDETPIEQKYPDLQTEYYQLYSRTEQPYAYVVKNGQVIAKLDNDGGATTGNASIARFDVNGGPKEGPALAQWRAEQIAKSTGGRIVMADTAESAATWKPYAPPTNAISLRDYVIQRLTDLQQQSGRPTVGLLDIRA